MNDTTTSRPATITAIDTRPFLHLGTTKTGSSFLQQRILARVERVQYFHKEIDLVTRAMTENAAVIDFGVPLARERKIILSHEALHGRAPHLMAPLLHRTFGESTVLVVTRSPVEWVQSFYFQRVRNGEERGPETWLADSIDGLARQLDFDTLEREYTQAFGAGNVHFLPYEMLRDAPVRFLDRVRAIAGLAFDPEAIVIEVVNKSATAIQMDDIRQANRYLNRLAENDEQLLRQMTDFRHALVRHLTDDAFVDTRRAGEEPAVFRNAALGRLFEGMKCLASCDWFDTYGEHYLFRPDAPRLAVAPGQTDRAGDAGAAARPESALDALGQRHNSDKAHWQRSDRKGNPRAGNDYLRHYERFLAPLRAAPVRVLELGAGPDWNLGASARTWKDYFVNAKTIHIVENRPTVLALESEGFAVTQGNPGKAEVLDALAAQPPWDVIIDDASHKWKHQVQMFQTLFARLKPGGVYIVEDLHTSFGDLRERFAMPYKLGVGPEREVDAAEYFLQLALATLGGGRANPAMRRDIFDDIKHHVDLGAIDTITLIPQACIIVRK